MAVRIHIASGVIVCTTLHNTQACFFQGSLIFFPYIQFVVLSVLKCVYYIIIYACVHYACKYAHSEL